MRDQPDAARDDADPATDAPVESEFARHCADGARNVHWKMASIRFARLRSDLTHQAHVRAAEAFLARDLEHAFGARIDVLVNRMPDAGNDGLRRAKSRDDLARRRRGL